MSANTNANVNANVVYEISRVCALSFRLTHTQTISPAMVLFAVEVLFNTKMDAEIDEDYEKEHKKEINKIGREMSKHLDVMIEEKIIEGKYRIGGNAPALVYRAKKTFGVEEPVEEKKTKKTKKPKAAEPEPVVVEEQKPKKTTKKLDDSVETQQLPEPVVEVEQPKPKKETKKKTAKKDAQPEPVAPAPAAEKPKKETKKKTAKKGDTEETVDVQVILFEDGEERPFDDFSGQEIASITDYLTNMLKVNETNIKFKGEEDEELFVTGVNKNLIRINEKMSAKLKQYGLSEWGKVEFMFKNV